MPLNCESKHSLHSFPHFLIFSLYKRFFHQQRFAICCGRPERWHKSAPESREFRNWKVLEVFGRLDLQKYRKAVEVFDRFWRLKGCMVARYWRDLEGLDSHRVWLVPERSARIWEVREWRYQSDATSLFGDTTWAYLYSQCQENSKSEHLGKVQFRRQNWTIPYAGAHCVHVLCPVQDGYDFEALP